MFKYILKKWKQFLTLIVGVFIIGGVYAAMPDVPMGAEMPEKEYITAPENNTFKIRVKNFQNEFKNNITDEKPLQYKLGDKYISFKPTEMKFDNIVLTTAKSSIKDNKKYTGIFGKGIDLEMKTGERVWSKIISINRLNNLGKIPDGTKFLEIEYEVETNFIINGWNKKDIFEITETTRLGDYSYIEPAFVWDNYREEVCEIIEEEKVCEILTNKIQIKSYFKSKDSKLIYTKQIPIEWLQNAEFPIWTDADITYGTASEFVAGFVSTFRVAQIDTNKFVVCYKDIWSPEEGLCKIATVDTRTITWNGSSEFNNDVIYLDTCELDTDKFVVVYTADALSDAGYARVATSTGTTINSWGTAVNIETGDMEHQSCAQLATDKFVTCYNDETDSDTGKCVICDVNGSVITCGSPTAMDGNNGATKDYYPKYTTTAKIDTNKFITCFEEEETGDDVMCIAATVSGTTITFGPHNTVTTDNSIYNSVSSLTTDSFVLCWAEAGLLNCMPGTVNTRTITYGDETYFDSSASNNSVINIDTTHFVSARRKFTTTQGLSNYSTVNFGAGTIASSTDEEFFSGDIAGSSEQGLDGVLISTNKIVICFSAQGEGDKGYCIIGDVAGEEPPEDTCTYSSGDWDVLYSDNCYITANTYVAGDFNLIYDAAGSFGLAAVIGCDGLNIGTGATVDMLNGTAEFAIY